MHITQLEEISTMIILPLKSGPSNRELDSFCSKKSTQKAKKLIALNTRISGSC